MSNDTPAINFRDVNLVGYLNKTTGAYLTRENELTQGVESTKVYAQMDIPSGTTLQWFASNDGGADLGGDDHRGHPAHRRELDRVHPGREPSPIHRQQGPLQGRDDRHAADLPAHPFAGRDAELRRHGHDRSTQRAG